MKLIKRFAGLMIGLCLLTGCSSSGRGDLTVLTLQYNKVATVALIENGEVKDYMEPGEFQKFCYAMNSIQKLYKLSEENIPEEGIEIEVTSRNQKYTLVLDSPNIKVDGVWFVADEETAVWITAMQDEVLNYLVGDK